MILPAFIEGKVIHGNNLGSKADMPTANIALPKETPFSFGVYYSKVYVDDCVYKSITNVGRKPTVNDTDSVNAESFIYDFSGDIYDKIIRVELIEFRRPEKKFDSFEKLAEEVHKDILAGKEYGIIKGADTAP